MSTCITWLLQIITFYFDWSRWNRLVPMQIGPTWPARVWFKKTLQNTIQSKEYRTVFRNSCICHIYNDFKCSTIIYRETSKLPREYLRWTPLYQTTTMCVCAGVYIKWRCRDLSWYAEPLLLKVMWACVRVAFEVKSSVLTPVRMRHVSFIVVEMFIDILLGTICT